MARGHADFVRRALLEGAELHRRAAATMAEPAARAAAEIAKRLSSGGTLFFFGNGGSASQAHHLAAEFTGRFKLERRGLAAVALGGNVAEITAIGNDYEYGEVFERPLAALARKGDVAIGLTGSGGSANVVRALRAARAKGALAIAFTSVAKDARGGPAGEAADLALIAPCKTSAEAQELHLAVGHVLCELVENELAKPRTTKRRK